MKKGFSYVDVMVSTGIFVIYIGFLFITLRPAIVEEYDEDYLINIVKNGFINDTYWTIDIVPLFITGNQTSSDINIEIPHNYAWPDKTFLTLNQDYETVNYGIDNKKLIIKKIDLILNENYTFYLVHPEEETTFTIGSPSGSETLTDYKNYTYGVYQPTTGISQNKLSSLEYESAKAKWNYPDGRDFYIISSEVNFKLGNPPLGGTTINILNIPVTILYENSSTIK